MFVHNLDRQKKHREEVCQDICLFLIRDSGKYVNLCVCLYKVLQNCDSSPFSGEPKWTLPEFIILDIKGCFKLGSNWSSSFIFTKWDSCFLETSVKFILFTQIQKMDLFSGTQELRHGPRRHMACDRMRGAKQNIQKP